MACDPNSIGQERQYQDPEDAERATHGVYNDLARVMPVESKIPNAGPRAPQPQPFGNLQKVGG